MVIPTPGSKPLEVHDADDNVIASLVTAEEMNRRQAEVEVRGPGFLFPPLQGGK